MSDTDMSSVIVPRSDQINADDLISGGMMITIREVKIKGGEEQPVSILFNGSDKAFRPCKSMSRVLVAAWGPDAKKYVGRSLELYRDPNVKWGGLAVGGIRIRAMSDIDQPMTMALTETRQSRKPFTVKPLATTATPAPTIDTPAELAKMQAAAANGTAALETAWGAATVGTRKALAAELGALKTTASEADAQISEDVPFGQTTAQPQAGEDGYDGV